MKFFEKFDTIILICLFILIVFSLMNSFSLNKLENGIFIKHTIWILLGILLFIIFQYIPVKIIMASSYFLFVFNFIILLSFIILLRIFKLSENNEIVLSSVYLFKLTFPVAIIRFLYNRKKHINSLNVLIGALSFLLFIFIPLLFVPDIGSIILLTILFVIILIISNVAFYNIIVILMPVFSIVLSFSPVIWTVYIVLSIIILFFMNIKKNSIIKITILSILTGVLTTLSWNIMSNIKKSQLINFLLSQKDIHGYGWDILQSKIAIGSGGLIGKGFLKGTQKGISFIQMQYKDFIYTVIAEEWGIIGFLIIVIPLIIILLRIIYLESQIKNEYSRILSITFINLIIFQMMANILMVLGIIPYFGYTLSLFSYHPVEILITMIVFGIINKISVERFEYW